MHLEYRSHEIFNTAYGHSFGRFYSKLLIKFIRFSLTVFENNLSELVLSLNSERYIALEIEINKFYMKVNEVKKQEQFIITLNN